jgi:hypothetical protein
MLLEDPERDTEGRSLLRKAERALLLGVRDWALDYLLDLVLSVSGSFLKPYVALASLEKEPHAANIGMKDDGGFSPGIPSPAIRASYLARTGKGGAALAELGPWGRTSPGIPRRPCPPRKSAAECIPRSRFTPGP